MVTSVLGRNTLTLLTGELVGATGSITCVKIIIIKLKEKLLAPTIEGASSPKRLSSVTHVPQALCSSEPSRQSSSPSQTNPKEMHSPLVTHLNSCEEQDGGAATSKTMEISFFKSGFVSKNKVYCSWSQHSRQFSSSESSVQSFVPSHLQSLSMHCPLAHWNSVFSQLPVKKMHRCSDNDSHMHSAIIAF